MIRRILLGLVLILILAFALTILLSGSYRQTIVNATHFRSLKSLKGTSIIQFIAGTGSSSVGDSFNLPGTPSSFPSLSIPDGGPTSTSEDVPPPTVIQAYGESSASTQENDQEKLNDLEAQYQALQAQAQAKNIGN